MIVMITMAAMTAMITVTGMFLEIIPILIFLINCHLDAQSYIFSIAAVAMIAMTAMIKMIVMNAIFL